MGEDEGEVWVEVRGGDESGGMEVWVEVRVDKSAWR